MREGGDIVNAQINSASAHNTWINLTVGVGGSVKRNARGLLAKSQRKGVDALAARSVNCVCGASVVSESLSSLRRQLACPIEGVHWLSPCGDRDIETGAASRPFYANDLGALAERVRAICTAAHVERKDRSLTPACSMYGR